MPGAEAPPLVVAIDMGYGHLRPAEAIAERAGVEVLELDRPPLASKKEEALWRKVRAFHENTSRWSQLPLIGPAFRALMDSVTAIPSLYPRRDLSAPHAGVKQLQRFIDGGLGATLVETLAATNAPLVTTFYAPAVVADHLGAERVFCVVTDSDINRIWAPIDPRRSKATYLAPSKRVVARLMAYGVAREKIILTGFPLPHELLGGPELQTARLNLSKRLVRLDPTQHFLQTAAARSIGPLPQEERGNPPRITFAVGGAGAQTELVDKFLPSLRGAIRDERLILTLVAGRRKEVAAKFKAAIEKNNLTDRLNKGVEILLGDDWKSYYRAFNQKLAETDVLWTKPSEMTFYAALGIPLLFSDPVGVHEKYNKRWAMEAGAGLAQRDLEHAGDWLAEWLEDGVLAAAAWAGFNRLPNQGLYRILDAVEGVRAAA